MVCMEVGLLNVLSKYFSIFNLQIQVSNQFVRNAEFYIYYLPKKHLQEWAAEEKITLNNLIGESK